MKGKRRFGSIRKLPSKRFQARYTGPGGKVHTAPETFDTQGDADAWLAVEWAAVQGGKWAPPSVVHAEHLAEVATYFGPYAEEVIKGRLATGKIRETTARLYRRYARLYFGEFVKQPLSAITTRQVAAWHASMARTPTSRANAYGFLAMVMHAALRDELISSTPCRVSAGGAKRSRRTAEDEVLGPSEFAAYIVHVPDRHGYPMALGLAFWCGLRSGEVRGLRRRDVDLKRRELTVAQQIVKLDGRNVISTLVKTDAGYRTVAIPPHFVGVMEDWLGVSPVKGRDALLFTAPTGDPMSGESLRAAGKKAAEAIGRPTLRVHSLRHSSATLFAQAGATTADMRGRFGWSSPSMATRYSHAVRERDQQLAERMSALAQN
jgi:integrase